MDRDTESGRLEQSTALRPTDKNEIGPTLRRVPRIDEGSTDAPEIARIPGNYRGMIGEWGQAPRSPGYPHDGQHLRSLPKVIASWADTIPENVVPAPCPPYLCSMGGKREVARLGEVGRLHLPSCAVADVEHQHRLAAFIDFINDPIDVRLLAIKQVS